MSGTSPISGVGDNEVQAAGLILEPNYPNPFNPGTSITYELPQAGRARLDVFDLAGRRVRNLQDGWISQGRHTVQWDGRDTHGNGVASGQYFYRLSVGTRTETRKMQLVR